MLKRTLTDTDSKITCGESHKVSSIQPNPYIRRLEMMKDIKKRKDSSTHNQGNSKASCFERSQQEADLIEFVEQKLEKKGIKNRKRNQSDPRERQDYNIKTDSVDGENESQQLSCFKKQYAKRKTSLWNPDTSMAMEILINLTEFITYNIQKQEMVKEELNQKETEMEAQSLEVLQKSLRQALSQRQEWQNRKNSVMETNKKIEEQIAQQIKRMQEQGQNLQMEIIGMVNNRAQSRERSRSVNNLNIQIQQKFTHTNQQFDRRESVFVQNKKQLRSTKAFLLGEMQQRQKETQNILELQKRIQSFQEAIFVQNKMQASSKLIYDHLIKQVAQKNLKKDLERKDINDNNLSNSQVMMDLEQKINKKISVIIHTITTNTENNKFINNLKLIEKQNDSKLSLTYERHTLNQQEDQILNNQHAYYSLYNYYLSRCPRITKCQANLQGEHTKNENLLNKVKAEIQEIKIWHEESLARLKEMENMQTIRQQEIKELQKILIVKNQEFDKYSNSKRDVFSSALMGFSMIRRSQSVTSTTPKKQQQ